MKRRVCSITHLNVQRENGPTLHVRGIADGFARLNVQVDLIASGPPGEYQPNGELISLAHKQPARPLEHLRFQLRILRFLAARRGTYDWLYVRAGSFMLTPLYQLTAGAPVALEINGVPHLEANFPGPLRALIRALFRWQVRGARRCVAVTPELCAYATRLGQQQTYAVPNGVDRRTICAASHRRTQRSGRRELWLVFVGALHAWQGVHLAVEAVRELTRAGHPVRLDILGDGPERGALSALVTTLGLQEHVHLRGHVGREAVHAALRDADIAVAPFMPDQRNRAVGGLSPLKLYEYLAFDLPVVTTSLVSDAELFAALPDSVRVAQAEAHAISRAILEVARATTPRVPPGAWIAHHRTWDAAARRTAAAMNLEVVP